MSGAAPLPATDKVRLLLTLVPFLIERGQVSLAAAAEEFGVTEAQMRTMVEKLTVIGLPGQDGYWQLPHELFDIDWDLLDERDIISITHSVALERAPRLSAREAAALLTGLQVTRALPGVAESQVFTDLLAKLARGASATPAEVVIAPGPVEEVRVVVSEALRDGVAIRFHYLAADARAETERIVDPVTVRLVHGQWYLQGWCHLRRAMRTFHLERVTTASLTETPNEHAGEIVGDIFTPRDDGPQAVVRFPEELAPLLEDYLLHADQHTEAGVTTATVRVADPRSLRRLAGRIGGSLEVLHPSEARQATRDWAHAALAAYSEQRASPPAAWPVEE